MAREFLGSGLRFPILPDETGTLRYADSDAHVEQSLKLLLLTSQGERVMRPNLGTLAPRLVFAPGSLQYLHLLEKNIQEAIRRWESRIDLIDVRAEMDVNIPMQANISISYRVRQTNSRNNLVFPFYFGNAEGR